MDGEILKMFTLRGYSAGKIAKELGCSRGRVRYWLDKLNSQTEIQKPINTDAKIYSINWVEVQQFYDKGGSYRTVHQKFGISSYSMNEARKRGLLKTKDSRSKFNDMISRMSDDEKFNHFSHKGNPNGKMGGYRANAGRTQKVRKTNINGQEFVLQSSYEARLADILNDIKILWTRPAAFKYFDGEKGRNYFPDFFLPKFNIFFDTKNDFLAKKDAQKIQQVKDQNSIDLRILLDGQINKQYILSILP